MRNLLLAFCFSITTLGLNAQVGLHFDGANDYVNCGTDTSLANFNKNITIEAWVNADKWQTNVYEGCIAVKEDNNSNYGYMLRAGAGGKLNFAIGLGTWRELTTNSSVMKTNTWYHVAATYDGSVMKLYLDGKLIDSMKETDRIGVSNGTPLTLGSHSIPASYSNRHWIGSIDEVRIWRTTRTASEIANNMKKEFCQGTKGLVAYYKLNDGTANGSNTANKVAYDWSGYKNDGRLLNFDLIKTQSNWVKGVSLSTTTTYDTITVRKCSSYRMPGSKKLIYQSGEYQSSLNNYMGCDSLLTIKLTIDRPSTEFIKLVNCDSVASPSIPTKYYAQSGNYKEVLKAANGCDSVIDIEVVITKPSYSEEKYKSCSEVKLKGSGKWVKESGTYIDSLIGWGGCDSIITHRVQIVKSTRDTQELYLCRFVVCPTDNNVIYKETGRYYDTIQNWNGCDSFIVYDVLPAFTEGEINIKACQKYTSPSGNNTWTSSGTYYDTLWGLNHRSCDSFITIYLEIVRPDVEQINITACEAYTSPQGKRVTESGKIFESIQSYLGCDSINYIYNVNIVKIDPKVSRDWNTLISASADDVGATFQWLDCKDNFARIPGEIEGSYTATASGEYAVEITKGKCVDTSRCQVFTLTSTTELSSNRYSVFPNPSTGNFAIRVPSKSKDIEIQLRASNGQILYQETLLNVNKMVKLEKQLSAGIYWLKIRDNEGSEILKLEIQP